MITLDLLLILKAVNWRAGSLNNQKPGIWQIVGAIIITLGAFVGTIWIIYGFLESAYDKQIKYYSVRDSENTKTIDNLQSEVNNLQKILENISAPVLLKTDTVKGNGHDIIFMGSKIVFSVLYISKGSTNNYRIRFELWNEIDSLKEQWLTVNPGDKYDFSVAGEPFYIQFTMPVPDSQLFVAEIYQYQPIWKNGKRVFVP